MAGKPNLIDQEEEEWNLDVGANLTYLEEHLGDLTGILTALIQSKIINDRQKEMILNEQRHPTSYEKNGKLLSILKENGWLKSKVTFIKILRRNLKDNCANLIEFHSLEKPATFQEQPVGTGSGQVGLNESGKNQKRTADEDDFELSELQMGKITSVLKNYPELKNDWEMVQISLRLSGESKGELNSHGGNFGTLILKTLKLWHKEKENKATFNAFVAAIQKATKHKLAAEQLRKKKETIRMIKDTDEDDDE